MSVRLILGAAGSGKTHRVLDEICAELLREPLDGPPLLLLVPEQATFQMERALLAHHPQVRAAARARVVSFKRLAHLILDEVGGGAAYSMDDFGERLALHMVIATKRAELGVFRGSAVSEGFLDQLAATLAELRAHRHGPESLAHARALLGEETLVGKKLRDIGLLYAQYQEFLAAHFHFEKTLLEWATERLAQAATLKGARLWIDGFAGLTPQEYALLAALFRVVSRVDIALCIDPEVLGAADPHAWSEGPIDELFHPTRETLVRLREIAVEAGVEIAVPTLLPSVPGGMGVDRKAGAGSGSDAYAGSEAGSDVDAHAHAAARTRAIQPRFAAAPLLGLIERALVSGRRPRVSSSQGSADGSSRGSAGASAEGAGESPVHRSLEDDAGAGDAPGMGSGQIATATVIEAPDRVGEVEAVAAEIDRLVRQEGLRYNQIAVIARDLGPYRQEIETVFAAWGIPYFLDVKEAAHHHPLLVLIRAAFDVVLGGFRSEAVFRYLKSDLAHPSRADVDRLENLALRLGVEGRDWLQERPDFEPCHAALKPLRDFFRACTSDGAEPCARFVDALRTLLHRLDVEATLARWAEEEAPGAPVDVHAQVLKSVDCLLGQLEQNAGDVMMDFPQFAEIVLLGLKRITIGRVPPRIDQVMVGSIERSRQPDLEAAIVIGCNDGLFPAVPSEDAVFSDEDRERLKQVGFPLSAPSRVNLYHESYLVYIALTRAKRRLTLSYARSDDGGRPMRPSAFVTALIKEFPEIEVRRIPAYQAPFDYPARKEALAGWLARAYRHCLDGDTRWLAQTDRLAAVHRWLQHQVERAPFQEEAGRDSWRPINPLRALGYRNASVRVPSALVRPAQGSYSMSPSGLESAAACLFQYFASYTLRLEERERPRLDPATLGSLSHAALRHFVASVQAAGRDLADLSLDDCEELASESLRAVMPAPVQRLIGASASERFLIERLERGIQAAAWIVTEHARAGDFRPAGLELTFGPRGELPSLRLTTADGVDIEVRGRIDRLDVAQIDGVRYLRVVDYKSSRRRLKLSDVIHGIDLQLVIYMLALADGSARWEAAEGPPDAQGRRAAVSETVVAGGLYVPVYDPLVSLKEPADEHESLWVKELRASGIILDDGITPTLMERSLSGDSALFPMSVRKDGSLGARSATATPDRMSALLQFVKEQLESLAGEVLSGRTDIAPYRLGGETPCTFCAYKPVCHFDASVAGNGYRRIRPEDDAWAVIEGAGKGGPAHAV